MQPLLQDAVIIGSRLDASQESSTCRLAFYGRILKPLDPNDADALQQIKIYKLKQKQGSIDRVSPDGLSAVCKGMFKKETDISLFSGMKVRVVCFVFPMFIETVTFAVYLCAFFKIWPETATFAVYLCAFFKNWPETNIQVLLMLRTCTATSAQDGFADAMA